MILRLSFVNEGNKYKLKISKAISFKIQILTVLSSFLFFYGKIAILFQFFLLIFIPLIWIKKYKNIYLFRVILVQLICQYFFLSSFLLTYHFTTFAIEKGVFRPLPSYVRLPVIKSLDNKIKEVFVRF